TVTVAVEIAVLEAHLRLIRAKRPERDVDLALARRIEIDGPVALDVPGQHEAGGRLEGQDGAPLALAALGVDVVAASADPRLDAELDDGAVSDVVLGRPPARKA